MATADVMRPRASPQHVVPADFTGGHEEPLERIPVAGTALLWGLLALMLYAASAHGAISSPIQAQVEVAIAGLAAAAGAGLLWTGGLRLSAAPLAFAGVASLAAYAIWSGITVLWSVAPDLTWLELNRALSYLIVLGLAIAAGASHPRSVQILVKGFLGVALAIAVYALGQKLVPGLHVGGLFDLNKTGGFPRLEAPLDYWNALALFITLGVPIALAFAVDAAHTPRARLGALTALELLLLTIGLTYSRGGLIALIAALGVAIALTRARLRSLAFLGLAALGAVPALIFGLSDHRLTGYGVSLSDRQVAGAQLAVVLLASLLALRLAARRLLASEDRLHLTPEHAGRVARRLVASGVVVFAVVVLVVTFSSRGLSGTISHAWDSFTSPKGTSAYNPSRLGSLSSGNRWGWWKQATGAFSDRPIAGWGAGSFPVVHLLYRHDTVPVKQPHSVPLQFLSETGVIGGVLGLGSYGLLLATGVAAVRRRRHGSERMLAAALLSGGVAYALHALYDWDWNIPGVTLPAIIFLGVLAGARDGRSPPRAPAPERPSGSGSLARGLWLGGVTLALCAFALSATLPSLAASKAGSAVVLASSSSPAQIQQAQADAEVASALDPLSDAGLRAMATIDVRRHALARALHDLSGALARNPTDEQGWAQLADLEFRLGNVAGMLRAVGRAVALDPSGFLPHVFELQAYQLATPPSGSATATPTPLG